MLAEERSLANPGARCRTPRATSAPGVHHLGARTPAVRNRLARSHNNTCCCCCLLLLSGSLIGTFASPLGTHSSSASTSPVTLSFAARRALCVPKPPNGPPDFPAASKPLPTPYHNPLRGGRKIRRPIVTSPSRLHRTYAAALGIVAAAEELLADRSGGPQDHRRATTGACGRIGFGDGCMRRLRKLHVIQDDIVSLRQSALQHPRDKPLPNRPLHPFPPQDANQNLKQQNAT